MSQQVIVRGVNDQSAGRSTYARIFGSVVQTDHSDQAPLGLKQGNGLINQSLFGLVQNLRKLCAMIFDGSILKLLIQGFALRFRCT